MERISSNPGSHNMLVLFSRLPHNFRLMLAYQECTAGAVGPLTTCFYGLETPRVVVGAESSLTVQSRGWKVSLYQILALGGKSIGELKSQTPQIIDPLIQFVLSSLV